MHHTQLTLELNELLEHWHGDLSCMNWLMKDEEDLDTKVEGFAGSKHFGWFHPDKTLKDMAEGLVSHYNSLFEGVAECKLEGNCIVPVTMPSLF